MGFRKEFKEFIMRGNVMDMAVGFIIGGAFSMIFSSLVDDMIMPVISLITGKIDFTNLFIALDGGDYKTIAAARDAGASVVAYGSFIQNVIQFLIIAFVLFLLIKGINKLHKPAPAAAPVTKICPFCKSEININATKCAFCGSDLKDWNEKNTKA